MAKGSIHWQEPRVRSRHGEKRYELADGLDAGLLRFVLRMIEPIPAIDTFVESDWRMKRDTVGGVQAVRVLAGYESPEGKLDPEQTRGYWFDDSGLLLKTYLSGIETDWSHFQDFSGFNVARQIDVLKDGRFGMRLHVTEVTRQGPCERSFELNGARGSALSPRKKARHQPHRELVCATPRLPHPLPFRLTFGIIRVCLDLTGLFRNKDKDLC